MSTPTSTGWLFLEPRPGFLRQLWIKGSALTARDVYGLHLSAEEPMTIEEIATEYNLSTGAIQEALTYCLSKPPEIEQDFLREEALREASGMKDSQYRGKPRSLSPQEWARIRDMFS
jgi:uncharacterized protein (DUF433 family)